MALQMQFFNDQKRRSCNGVCSCFPAPDPDRIGLLLSNSILEAHTRTSLLTREQIQEHWKAGVDQARLFAFKGMAQEGLWTQAAERLTSMITQIIEFAKMVPGFMKFPQDDQIVLLKGGGNLLSFFFNYTVKKRYVLDLT